jgi:hypothetical protein
MQCEWAFSLSLETTTFFSVQGTNSTKSQFSSWVVAKQTFSDVLLQQWSGFCPLVNVRDAEEQPNSVGAVRSYSEEVLTISLRVSFSDGWWEVRMRAVQRFDGCDCSIDATADVQLRHVNNWRDAELYTDRGGNKLCCGSDRLWQHDATTTSSEHTYIVSSLDDSTVTVSRHYCRGPDDGFWNSWSSFMNPIQLYV